MIESLMTMPDSPKKPKIDIMVTSKPSNQCPKIAPIRANGSVSTMISDFKMLLNCSTSSNRTVISDVPNAFIIVPVASCDSSSEPPI